MKNIRAETMKFLSRIEKESSLEEDEAIALTAKKFSLSHQTVRKYLRETEVEEKAASKLVKMQRCIRCDAQFSSKLEDCPQCKANEGIIQ